MQGGLKWELTCRDKDTYGGKDLWVRHCLLHEKLAYLASKSLPAPIHNALKRLASDMAGYMLAQPSARCWPSAEDFASGPQALNPLLRLHLGLQWLCLVVHVNGLKRFFKILTLINCNVHTVIYRVLVNHLASDTINGIKKKKRENSNHHQLQTCRKRKTVGKFVNRKKNI